jgi:hypothetical protein
MKRSQTTTKFGFRSRFALACALVGMSFVVTMGCGTTTTRTATEQLLMSDAVDNAIAQIDFRVLQGRKVFIDTLYLHSVAGVGFVNSEYIISSLRQQLTAAQCLIQDSRETADIVVEPRVGALGTDGHEVVYGIPQSGSLASAAAALSSSPLPPIPEISFGKSNAQTGIAKVIVFAYDRETRQAIWQSGIARAESTSRNTWYLGAGPFQKGSIHEGTKFAGQEIPPPPTFEQMAEDGLPRPFHSPEVTPKPKADFIPYKQAFVFNPSIPAAPHPTMDSPETGKVQTAGHEEELNKK